MLKQTLIKILPFLSIGAAILIDYLVPDSELQPQADKPYFIYFLIIMAGIYGVFFIASYIFKAVNKKLLHSAPFYAGVGVILIAINLAISKFALLPVLFFPNLDRIFGVFATDWELIIECILASGKLLIKGYLIGAGIGFVTGILIGFNRHAEYWISPLMRFIGPIPATSWSPLILSLFSKTYNAAVFMVALSVWFPITLMTYNGVQNINNSYFEVASTLGAGKMTKVFRVGIPAAMPNVFLGVFYATCNAFVTLVAAELLGADAGLGWYLNWQKSMMLYANVYAGLIVIAVLCTLIISLVFKVKDMVLVWQKGVIKW